MSRPAPLSLLTGSSLRWAAPGGDGRGFLVHVGPTAAARTAGRVLVAVGGLVLLFTTYQLWGTGLVEGRAQRRLDAELAATWAQAPAAGPGVSETSDPPTGPAGLLAAGRSPATTAPGLDAESRSAAASAGAGAGPRTTAGVGQAVAGPEADPTTAGLAVTARPAPAEGTPLARLELPTIGVSKTIVQGVGRDTLRGGPGHYPSSALPGERGNVAIAGHRTTYGAPFQDLDQLAPGDRIELVTEQGVLTYEVQAHEGTDGEVRGHRIVDPSAVGVIADHGDDRLTLTACHPLYSARQRIVVSALLVDGPPPPAPVAVAATSGRAHPGTPAEPATLATEYASPAPPVTSTPGRADASPTGSPGDPAAPDVAVTGSTAGPAALDVAVTGSTVRPAAPDVAVPGPTAGRTVGGSVDDGLGWQGDEAESATLWATVVGLVAASGWIGGRLWRPVPAGALAAVAALAPLLALFVHLDRLLPAY